MEKKKTYLYIYVCMAALLLWELPFPKVLDLQRLA